MEDKSIKTATGYEIRVNCGNLFKNNSENPQASSDHHEDINKHNLKYADSEYHQWELEQQQQDEKGD